MYVKAEASARISGSLELFAVGLSKTCEVGAQAWLKKNKAKDETMRQRRSTI